jgi:hypothetical protein
LSVRDASDLLRFMLAAAPAEEDLAADNAELLLKMSLNGEEER